MLPILIYGGFGLIGVGSYFVTVSIKDLNMLIKDESEGVSVDSYNSDKIETSGIDVSKGEKKKKKKGKKKESKKKNDKVENDEGYFGVEGYQKREANPLEDVFDPFDNSEIEREEELEVEEKRNNPIEEKQDKGNYDIENLYGDIIGDVEEGSEVDQKEDETEEPAKEEVRFEEEEALIHEESEEEEKTVESEEVEEIASGYQPKPAFDYEAYKNGTVDKNFVENVEEEKEEREEEREEIEYQSENIFKANYKSDNDGYGEKEGEDFIADSEKELETNLETPRSEGRKVFEEFDWYEEQGSMKDVVQDQAEDEEDDELDMTQYEHQNYQNKIMANDRASETEVDEDSIEKRLENLAKLMDQSRNKKS